MSKRDLIGYTMDAQEKKIDLALECMQDLTEIAMVQKNVAIAGRLNRFLKAFADLNDEIMNTLQEANNE